MTTDARLLSFIQRIERLETEKAAIAADVKEVKAEAKSAGYDLKTINEILRLRKMEEAERQEREAMLDTYKAALGMISDLPLGKSAISRATGEKPEGVDEDAPETIERAKAILRDKPVRDDGSLSGCTSYIQRHLDIGYNKAARILERLERDGFVTAQDIGGYRRLSGLKNTLAAVG